MYSHSPFRFFSSRRVSPEIPIDHILDPFPLLRPIPSPNPPVQLLQPQLRVPAILAADCGEAVRLALTVMS
jgi:hypothetical protein